MLSTTEMVISIAIALTLGGALAFLFWKQRKEAKVLEEQMRQARISPLPIYPAHVLRVAALPPIHKDPFDRLLIAQAQAENLALVTQDPEIRRYTVQVIW